jgi:hypothetical protein
VAGNDVVVVDVGEDELGGTVEETGGTVDETGENSVRTHEREPP